MEDEHPSLPLNYVSLVQLQERWLKEKHREKEEQERKCEEDQQKQRRKENGDKGLDNSLPASRRPPIWRNRQNRGARDRKMVEESNPNLEVSKIEAVVSQNEPKKDELKKRVKKKKNKRRKPVVEENLAGVTSQMAPVEKLQGFVNERNGESEQIESKFRRNGGDQGMNHKVLEPKVQIDQVATLAINVEKLSLNDRKEELSLNDRKECMRSAGKTNAGRRQYSNDRKLSKQRHCNPVEKLQVSVIERNDESEQIESKFQRNGGGDQGMNHKVLESKVQIDQAATLARNVEELSLNDRKECMRSAGKTNAGRRQYSRASERADRQKLSKQRDCNLVWVKKGEITGTEIQSSGNSVKAGMDKKQRLGHSKQ